MVYENVLEAVGNTPLIRLGRIVPADCAEILVAAAFKLAKKLGPGKTVVTVLPDTAERYFSTPLFDE